MHNMKKVAQKADRLIGSNLSIVSKNNVIKKIKSFGRYKNNAFFWNNGALTLALNKCGFQGKNLSSLEKKKAKIKEIDDTLYYYANFDHYDIAAHNKIYDFVTNCPISKGGSILYRRKAPYVFIDSLGMVCPYMMRYYHFVNQDNKILDIVFDQFNNFFNKGFDANSGLPYHGFDINEKNKLGIIGWGRAVGWLLFGFAECLDYFPKNDKRLDSLKLKVNDLLQILYLYIRKDGSFSWLLQALDGPADTSATAMIGYSVNKMAAAGFVDDDFSELLCSIECFLLENITESGSVINSSAECQGFSMYPQKYENNSWGQAFTVLFLVDRGYALD